MGQQHHKEFQRELMNIKTQDVRTVAARMCRILRDFPRNYTARKVTVDQDGHDEVLDRTGSAFDTVWDENIGSTMSCVDGGSTGRYTMTYVKNTLEALYGLSKFLINHGNTIMYGEAKKSTYDSDLSEINTFFTTWKISNFASTARYLDPYVAAGHAYTYGQLGFYLDQAHLDGTTESRPFDVYEFLKWLVHVDILGLIIAVRGTVESDPWKACVSGATTYNRSASTYKSTATDLQTKATNVIKLTGLIEEMVIHMAHLIDGISVCEVGAEAEDAIKDFEHFTPIDDEHYETPSAYQPTTETFTFNTPKAGNGKRLVILTKSPVRLNAVYLESKEIESALANLSPGGGYNTVYVTKDFNFGQNKPIRIELSRSNTGIAFSPSLVKVYVNKD